jgi:hypothetical protein
LNQKYVIRGNSIGNSLRAEIVKAPANFPGPGKYILEGEFE